MVELMLALSIMTVCTFMLSQTIVSTIGQTPAKRERTTAIDAARNILEDMRKEPFSRIFALYNSNPADDPGGPGTAPGPNFQVPELVAQDGDPDGFVGEIILPGPGPALSEETALEDLGLPRDLNGDSIVDDQDHSGDYQVLPVMIRIDWQGRAGERTFEMHALFANLSIS
jgi:hypothetical protein